MPFTDEQRRHIAAAISEKRSKGAPPMVCPVCFTSNWTIGEGMVRLVIQDDPSEITLEGPSYPMVPLLCQNCGNTYLLNVFVLGIGELMDIKPGIRAVLRTKVESGNG